MTQFESMEKALDLLGFRVEDRVSGFRGVVASITFDLYGCVQAIVNPGLGADGKMGDQVWFDVNRLLVTDPDPVMESPWSLLVDAGPVAGEKGPAERPAWIKP